MTEPSRKVPVIECDKDLYIKISTDLQHSITGKPVYLTESLVDLVNKHCPHLYDLAEEKGFKFVPSDDASLFEQHPIDIRFDIIRIAAAN